MEQLAQTIAGCLAVRSTIRGIKRVVTVCRTPTSLLRSLGSASRHLACGFLGGDFVEYEMKNNNFHRSPTGTKR